MKIEISRKTKRFYGFSMLGFSCMGYGIAIFAYQWMGAPDIGFLLWVQPKLILYILGFALIMTLLLRLDIELWKLKIRIIKAVYRFTKQFFVSENPMNPIRIIIQGFFNILWVIFLVFSIISLYVIYNPESPLDIISMNSQKDLSIQEWITNTVYFGSFLALINLAYLKFFEVLKKDYQDIRKYLNEKITKITKILKN